MMRALITMAAAAAVAVAWFAFRDASPESQAGEQRLTPEQRNGYRSLKRAGVNVALPPEAPDEPHRRGRLYHPPVNYDEVSVAGEQDVLASRELSSDQVQKLMSIHKRPAPEAIAAGEEEKNRRRSVTPHRSERPRAWGKMSGHGHGQARKSPSKLVRDKQRELEESGRAR